MRMSLSVNLSDILTEKKSILENLFSWGSFSNNGFHPGRVFSLLKDASIEGIELVASKDIKMVDLEKLKTVLAEKKISVFNVHQPILTLCYLSLEKIKHLFETAAYLSAGTIVVHLFSLGKRIYDPFFLKELKSLEEKFGIKITVENGTKNIILGLMKYCYEGKRFSEAVLKAGFGMTFDVSHLGEAGGDVIGFYERHKKRILNIHLSDYKDGFFKNNLFNMHLPLGEGILPIKQFLKKLKDDRYNGSLVFEINRGVEEIKKSIAFARQILAA